MSGSSDSDQCRNSHEFPTSGRLLGLDFGTKRLGIAVCTPDHTIASPVENYNRRDKQQDARQLQQFAREYGAVGLVVGLPVHLSGEESEKSRQARNFGNWAGQVTGLPVRFWDERFTSVQAEEYLLEASLSSKKRKARLDMVAAQIMLQSYLESGDKQSTPAAL